MSNPRKRLLIVGGVAGGASCAARARRLCEHCDIVMFDRGPYVSFANCGLPYYVADVITAEAQLLVATPHLFKERLNITVHTETEVVSIDRAQQAIEVCDLRTGQCRREPYDALVLATGAQTYFDEDVNFIGFAGRDPLSIGQSNQHPGYFTGQGGSMVNTMPGATASSGSDGVSPDSRRGPIRGVS